MKLKFRRIPHSIAVKPCLWIGSLVGLTITVSLSACARLSPASAGSLRCWRSQPASNERLSFVISLWQCALAAVLGACAESAFACLNEWLKHRLDRDPDPISAVGDEAGGGGRHWPSEGE